MQGHALAELFCPVPFSALKCTTHNQKMKTPRKRSGLANFAISSSSRHVSPCSTGVSREAQPGAASQLGQGYPALCFGEHPGMGERGGVPTLFRMLTPGKCTPVLDLAQKTIQSLPNAPKAIKNKKPEGRQGGKSGGLT